MEELKKEMAEIKAAIDYQGKLIEEIYQNLDEGRKNQSKAMPNIGALMDMIGNHPTIKSNPAMQGMIRNLFAGMGGTNGN